MSYKLRLPNKTEPIEFLTIGEVAKLCNKSTDALKKLTQRGILPDANFRTPPIKTKNGEETDGYRLYSKDFLVPKLVDFLKNKVSQGVTITHEQQTELYEMFSEERKQLM